MDERQAVMSQILAFLAKRVTQQNLPLRLPHATCEKRLHLRDMVTLDRLLAQVGADEIGVIEPRI
jgi:hypothetical protein